MEEKSKDGDKGKAAAAAAVKVVSAPDEYIGGGRLPVKFQSSNARKLAETTANPPADSDEVVDAVIAVARPGQEVPDNREFEKMVTIRPRVSVPRFRYGDQWYHLERGKRQVVPKHMAITLEQRGVL